MVDHDRRPDLRALRRKHVHDPVWFVPLVAAATIALPAAAQERHAEGPSFLGADGDAAVDAAHAVVRQDREGFEQPDEMPDLSGDAAWAARRPQLIQQAMDGVADIVWTLPGYTAGRFPVMEVFELPFMSQSAEATSQAAWEYYTQYGYKEFPGIKALAVNVHDNGYVHTVAKQVKVMADFKGLKMRAPTRQTNKLLGRARRDPGRDAAAGARRRAVEGRGRRLHAAVGSDPVDQGARVHEIRKRDRSEGRARSTPRCSSSR